MRNKKWLLIILLFIISSISLKPEINNTTNTSEREVNSQDFKNEILKTSDPFIPDPDPFTTQHNGTYWDFTNDTIVAWNIETPFGNLDYTYNISSMRYFSIAENATGTSMEHLTPWEVYGVELEPVYWDSSINDFKVDPTSPVINASLINYTNSNPNEKMLPFKMEGFDDLGPMLNLFIPKNFSDALDIFWCANALHWLYSLFLTGKVPTVPADYADMTITSTSIHYYYAPYGTYCDLYYSPNGILETGELYTYLEGQLGTLNFTRSHDLNPLNDTEWNVDVGDVLYMGLSYHELKFNISKFENITVDLGGLGRIPLKVVWANMSMWNVSTETWDYVDMDGGVNWIIIGSANDNFPFMFPGEDKPFIPLLMPINFSISDLAVVMEFRGDENDPTFSVTYGDNWVRISNSSGYANYIYNASGFLELNDQNGFETEFGYEEVLVFRKNSTIIDDSKIWELEIIPINIGSSEFNITMDIKVNDTTHLLTSAMSINPLVNHTLSSGVLFFDIWINETDNLNAPNVDAPINITIDYDKSKYKNMKLYWFNQSLMDPENGEWLEIPFTDYGNGTIVFSVNHTSIFAFTNVIAQVKYLIFGDDDDDDDDNDELAIPIGNYYLIFIAIAIIGLIIYKKRELFKK